jgi:hypothetical protein
MGLEGLVSKRKAAWYLSGRSRDWVKAMKSEAPGSSAVGRRGLGTIIGVKPVTMAHIRSNGP